MTLSSKFGTIAGILFPSSKAIGVVPPTAMHHATLLPGDATAMRRVRGETRLLWGTEPSLLYWAPHRIEAVYGFDTDGNRIDFCEGQDWVAVPGGIARTARSRIYDFAQFRYFPYPPGASWRRRIADALRARSPARSYDSSRAFHFVGEPRNPPLTLTLNVYVDYLAELPEETVQPVALALGARRVFCIGDSITEGAHTVGHFFHGDDRDGWCGLLRSALTGRCDFRNLSVGGATVAGAVSRYDEASARYGIPDLTIIAFGMNDHVAGAEAIPRFETGLRDAVRRAKADGSKVVLVGFFEQNPDWVLENVSDTRRFNDAIRRIARDEDVPFVDIAQRFAEAAAGSPEFLHLTGDFMHHPNNYGQRLYFSALLPFFLDTALPCHQIEGFVQLTTSAEKDSGPEG